MKMSAAWLLALVLSPFTAPFQVVDFDDDTRASAREGALIGPGTATSADDQNLPLVHPLPGHARRLRVLVFSHAALAPARNRNAGVRPGSQNVQSARRDAPLNRPAVLRI